MTWSAPPTFADGNLLTASQLNTLSADLNETAAAKATSSFGLFTPAGTNIVAQRLPASGAEPNTSTTTSTTYTTLAGSPFVTATTGTAGLLVVTGGMMNSAVGAECFMSYVTSGATTTTASDQEGPRHTSATASAQMTASWAYVVSLTAGSNTFSSRYRVSSGTGSFFDRRISIVPF